MSPGCFYLYLLKGERRLQDRGVIKVSSHFRGPLVLDIIVHICTNKCCLIDLDTIMHMCLDVSKHFSSTTLEKRIKQEQTAGFEHVCLKQTDEVLKKMKKSLCVHLLSVDQFPSWNVGYWFTSPWLLLVSDLSCDSSSFFLKIHFLRYLSFEG